VNACLAFIEGAKPQGEDEAGLVIQMACTHAAAMAVLETSGALTAPPEASRPERPQPRGCCVHTHSRSRLCGD